MTDIVERLRKRYPNRSICSEGAEEIDRLREGRDTMGNLWAREREARCKAEAEIKRLQAEIERLEAELDLISNRDAI